MSWPVPRSVIVPLCHSVAVAVGVIRIPRGLSAIVDAIGMIRRVPRSMAVSTALAASAKPRSAVDLGMLAHRHPCQILSEWV